MRDIVVKVIGVDGKESRERFDTESEYLNYLLLLSYTYDVILDREVVVLSEKEGCNHP